MKKLIAIVCIVCALFLVGCSSSSDDLSAEIEQLKNQISDLIEENNNLKEEITELENIINNSNDTTEDEGNSEKLDNPALIKELIKVYGLQMKTDYGEGIDIYVDWENLSEREIKYMHFNLELYNRVGDTLTCDITGKKDIWIYQTGPIPKGKGMYNVYSYNSDVAQRPFRPDVPYSEYKNDSRNGWVGIYWDSVWYNSQAYCVKIIGVKIEYQDGTVFKAKDYSFSDNLEYHLSVIGDDVFNFKKSGN